MRALLAGLFLLVSNLAFGQSVQQSGSVTPGHPAYWITRGVIGDGGSAAQGSLTGLGVTANGPSICANSGPITGAFNRMCIGATQTGGGVLSVDNVNGGTGGFTMKLNGVTQGIATVTLPVTTNDGACFADTTGTLKDCGGAPISVVCSTPGDFPVWNGVSWQCSTAAGSTATLNGGPLTINPTTSSLTQGLLINQTAAGGSGSTAAALNKIILGDNAAQPTYAFNIEHGIGSGFYNSRQSLNVHLFVTGAPNVASTDFNYVAGVFTAEGRANVGGGLGTEQGQVFGLNPSVVLTSGATNYLNLAGVEVNVEAQTGSSVSYKTAISLVAGPNDKVQGYNYDTALSISSQSGAVGWSKGILFSRANGVGPMKSDGVLIATQGADTAAVFADASSYTFSNHYFIFQNFVMTAAGVITTGTWHGTAIGEIYGGTNQTSYALGDTLYASAANTLNKLSGNTTTTKKFLSQTGTGSGSAAPAWDTIIAGDLPLANTHIFVGNSSGVAADVAMSGDTTIDNTGAVTIGSAKVSYAKIQNLGALALMGRSANSSGVGADIQATAASDCVFRESSSTIGCGTVATAGLANNAVTVGKLEQAGANTILGNPTGSTANVQAMAAPSGGTSGCSAASNAAIYTAGTGWGCNTSITASSATDITTTDDTSTNTSYYPTIQTATGGTNPLKTSSTKLFFNPSTGLLTSTAVKAQNTFSVGWGTSAPIGFTFEARANTNKVFAMGEASVGTGILFSSVNDANNAYENLQFASANTGFTAGGVQIGSLSLTTSTGELGFSKIAASGSAPGASGAKIAVVCGTSAGTAKIIAYAGTSTTPTTVLDNIGSGVTGC